MDKAIGALIPIVAIVMGIGMGFWRVYWDHQRKRLQYEERRLMIEKGMEPPPMPPDAPRRTLQASLRWGITLVSLGIGLAITYLILRGPEVLTPPSGSVRVLVAAAVVTLLLGVGNLIYYRVAKGQQPTSPST